MTAALRARARVARAEAVAAHLRMAHLRTGLRMARGCEWADALADIRLRLASAEDQIANLRRALVSSRRIGMALGIVMARYQVAEAQAFEMLTQDSQGQSRRLREIADDVINTGALPVAER